MDEVRTKKVEIEVNQGKIDYINHAYSKKITYQKKAALDRVSTENEEKQLMDLAPLRVPLICKAQSTKTENVDEIIFDLQFKYSTHNEKPRLFIDDIPREEPSFEAIFGYLKIFSKSIKEDENMNLKNKYLFGGWILMASKVYRMKDLSRRFKDWLYSLSKIKRQVSYN